MAVGEKSFFLVALAFAFCYVACSNSESYSDARAIEVPEPVMTAGPDLEWTWVHHNSDQLRITGRTNYEKGDFVILSWSSSAITVGFMGTAVEASVWTGDTVYLDVFVDGEEDPSSFLEIASPDIDSTIFPVVSNLPYGPHVVTLYKRSEAKFGDLYFFGLRVLGEADKSLLPAPPEHKIEFIGNSITCGSDVLIPVQGGEFRLINESSYYGYAGQTARILHAEIHNICNGGHGVYLNCDGSNTFLLPFVYNRTGALPFVAFPWDHNKWHPDAVVVNLGTNDFASGKNDSTGFVNATVKFIRRIRTYHPEAKIVLLDGPMLTGKLMALCRRYLDVAKATLEKEGIKDLYRFSLEPKGESPYDVYFHPNKEEAAQDAESLSAWIRSEFGWN